MTVAVLNPQDCLIKDYRFSKQPLISPMKDSRSYRSNRTQQPPPPPNRTKRSPPRSHKNPPTSRSSAPTKAPAKNNLVMGQVKILKRGEELTLTAAAKPIKVEPEKKKGGAAVQKCSEPDPDLGSTERLGPEPESVPIQIRLADSKNGAPNFYAGSAFVTSPPPSSLPLPAFFTKKAVVAVKNDDATSDLRRILKLDVMV
ncbi:hypothetical protein ACOSQ4_008231 [Xanthoceras sorbifolium]